ncbi:MAG: B12-binding domain-containing radical SAM protein [Ignavibacteria bacterium]|nr:B12-binding domain-containing radical SAM protein [Ignavibacteria bacterium]
MIILLNPKSARFGFRVPNSLLYLGAFLENKYDYEIVDENLNDDVENTLIKLIKEKNIKYLGITVMPGPQLHRAVPISKKIKSLFPEVKILWGGYFPSLHRNTVLKADYVDVLFRGHAEISLPEYLDCMEKKPGAKALYEIKGISFKSDGKIINNPDIDSIDPDMIPLLPYHKVEMEKYLQLGKTYLGRRTIAYISSIGCPFTCGFCAIAGIYKGKWKGRSAELVADDLRYLREKYKIDAVEFHDDNMFVSEKRIYSIADKIKDMNLGWWGEARPDTMLKYSDETLELMQRSGVKMIFYGAESSSEETLKLMNKGGTQTPDTVIKLAERLKKYKIIPEFSFVLGSPSDDMDKSIDNDIKYIKKVKEVNRDSEIIIYIYSPVNYEDSEMSLASKLKGFEYPATLEEWTSEKWKSFDLRKKTMTPWLKSYHINKIQNFDKVLNAFYPTVSDLKIRGWRKKLLNALGSWRYSASFYHAPYEVRFAMKLLKYRQPEVEGFSFQS